MSEWQQVGELLLRLQEKNERLTVELDWATAALRALAGSPAEMLAYLRAHHIYFDHHAPDPPTHWRQRIAEVALAKEKVS